MTSAQIRRFRADEEVRFGYSHQAADSGGAILHGQDEGYCGTHGGNRGAVRQTGDQTFEEKTVGQKKNVG